MYMTDAAQNEDFVNEGSTVSQPIIPSMAAQENSFSSMSWTARISIFSVGERSCVYASVNKAGVNVFFCFWIV
jgi:hypothetical protein